MKKEYIKPTLCVVKLMNGCSLLAGSAKNPNGLGDFPFGTYSDDEDIIDEGDVI
jgi:hypothetical protein